MNQIKNGNKMRTNRVSIIWKLLILTGISVSCNSSFPVDIEDKECQRDTKFTSRMILDGKVDNSYDGDNTRASSYWKDGDRLYVFFASGNDEIDGYAEYDDETDEWILTYSKEIPNTTNGTCRVLFIKDSVYTSSKELSYNSPVYAQYDGTFDKNESEVKLKATLRPVFGRIRFRGESGKRVQINNLKYFKSFSEDNGAFEYDDAEIDISVKDDGYTDYLYCDFASNDRELIIHQDLYYEYKKKCNDSILRSGESGCMELPTDDNPGEWIKVCEIPDVKTNCIENVMSTSAKFTGELLEESKEDSYCGFVWSISENPTLDTSESAYNVSKTGKFEVSVSNLSLNTKYYVRAFVKNSFGVRYGDNRWFTTGTNYNEPYFTMFQAFDITGNSASISSWIDKYDSGNHDFISGGCCLSLAENPTIDNYVEYASDFIHHDDGDLYFRINFENLEENTVYYARGFVIAETGHLYYSRNEIVFVTEKAGD